MKKYFFIYVFAFIFGLFLNPFLALSDKLQLKDGSVVTGKFKSLSGSNFDFKTQFAGKIKVKLKDVFILKTDDIVYVDLKNGETEKGYLEINHNRYFEIYPDKTYKKKKIISFDSTKKITLKKDEDIVKFSGTVNGAASKSQGNTVASNFDFSFNLKVNMYKIYNAYFSGEIEQDTKNSVQSANKWNSNLQIDRYVSESWFVYVNSLFEHDYFKDLRLRTTAGGGIGYTVLKSKPINLYTELGLNYVHQDFMAGKEDSDYPAFRWSIGFEAELIKDYVQLYHTDTGYISLIKGDDIFLTSKTGLKFPIYRGFYIAPQFEWEWDNEPVAGKKRNDTEIELLVGYTWN